MDYSGGNVADIDNSDNQIAISVQTTEIAKKSLEDTDVNLTNTSAAIFGDTSAHFI